MHRNRKQKLLAFLAVSCLFALPATAEPVLSAYGGWAGGMSPDDGLTGAYLPDFELSESSRSGADQNRPLHYGARLAYWTGDNSRWGFAGDYTHATTLARLVSVNPSPGGEVGPIMPTPGGSAPPRQEQDIYQTHNLVTFNGVFRWLEPGSGVDHPRHWLVPYVGLGVGMAVSPIRDDTLATEAIQDRLAGPAAQGLVGGEILVGGRWSMFVEYKLSWADLTSEASNGSSLTLEPWTQHVALGLSMKF